MCGRYANHVKDMGVWADILHHWPDDFELSYNVAPTQNVPVFYKNKTTNNIISKSMRWGLIPSWSSQPNSKYATFNARAETMADKPTFKDAWKKSQTCLFPALGYYEWSGAKGNKQPFFIRKKDNAPLVMAGLWEYWHKDTLSLFSCTIITHPAQGELEQIHSRMPVLLEPSHAESWLEDGTNRFNLITKQQHINTLDFYPVSKDINNGRSVGEKLITKQTDL